MNLRLRFYYRRWRVQLARLWAGLVGTLTLGFVHLDALLLRMEDRMVEASEDYHAEGDEYADFEI